ETDVALEICRQFSEFGKSFSRNQNIKAARFIGFNAFFSRHIRQPVTISGYHSYRFIIQFEFRTRKSVTPFLLSNGENRAVNKQLQYGRRQLKRSRLETRQFGKSLL